MAPTSSSYCELSAAATAYSYLDQYVAKALWLVIVGKGIARTAEDIAFEIVVAIVGEVVAAVEVEAGVHETKAVQRRVSIRQPQHSV